MKAFTVVIVFALFAAFTPTEARADVILYPGDAISGPMPAGLVLLYQAEVPEDSGSQPVEEGWGLIPDWYTTSFVPPTDPDYASIAWNGPGSIATATIYLYVKDGVAHTPPDYLFDISGWDGKATIQLQDFWPNQGAISHVAIYGTASSVPDGSVTLILLGGVLVGLEALRRRLGV